MVPLAALGLLAACGSDEKSGSGGAGETKTVEVSLTENGCEPAAITTTAGSTTFHVTNKGAAGVTEFEVLAGDKIVGEVENIAPGIDRTVTMTLAAGSYVTYCPGGKTEKGTLEVTAASGSATTA